MATKIIMATKNYIFMRIRLSSSKLKQINID